MSISICNAKNIWNIHCGLQIRLDGDNVYIERLWRSVKQENIYLNAYENGQELYAGVKEYFDYYNNKRYHQSLDYKTPVELYKYLHKIVA